MTSERINFRPYTRAERLSDGVVHIVGIILALMFVPVLISLTALSDAGTAAIVGVSVYGATLLLMLTCSALYNMIDNMRWHGVLKRLDHSAIYVKIAGTYTPFTLLTGASTGLLAGLWTAAVFGLSLKMIAPDRWRWCALTLYLAMGWAAVYAGGPMLAGLPRSVLVLMVIGGILYTAGVIFYLRTRMPFHNTIWHVFVLAGSVVFFVAVSLCIAQVEPHLIETA